MARHTDRVRTFSIGFVPGEESELGWARLVADRCGADHHEFELGSEDFFSLLQRLVWHHDEPMMFPASIPLYLLSRESKPAATVMLAGEGADEILAGYDGNVRAYWMNRLASPIPAAVRRLAARLPLPGRAGAAAARVAGDETQMIAGTYRLGGHIDIARACRVALPSADEDDQALVDEVGLATRDGSFLDRLLYFQLKTYLVALLMKQDKMSMAASIETRVPSDRRKVNGRRGKYLLKEACRGLLPQEVIDRPKRGFPVPIAQWFREKQNPFVDILLDPETLRDGFLDPVFVRARVERFRAGEPISVELWAMLNLELWRRTFLTGVSRVQAIAS
jgi:asparagine synthase (glutamine-hydrolysing)